MKSLATRLLVTAALALASMTATAEDRPYTEGPVITLSYIKIMPGQFDNYMKYLATTWKTLMEEQKKAGIITGYAVYGTSPRTPNDPDLVLVTEFKNFAAMDGMEAKSEAIMAKVWGTAEKANAASIDRGKMRTELGGEVMRQLILK